MPLEDEFRELMTSTVTVEPYVSQDKQNKPTYGATLTFWAYVEMKPRQIVGPDGNLTVSSGIAYMDPTTKDKSQSILLFSTRSRVTINGSTAPTKAVGYLNDEVGLHHYQLWF